MQNDFKKIIKIILYFYKNIQRTLKKGIIIPTDTEKKIDKYLFDVNIPTNKIINSTYNADKTEIQ